MVGEHWIAASELASMNGMPTEHVWFGRQRERQPALGSVIDGHRIIPWLALAVRQWERQPVLRSLSGVIDGHRIVPWLTPVHEATAKCA